MAAGPSGVAFSSEKKSLLELTGALGLPEGTAGSLDEPALQHYLILQYVPEPATLHRSVRRIESGCSFTVRPGGEVEQERYFTPRFTRDRAHRAGRRHRGRRRPARLGGQAHARRRHRGRVPLRRDRLHGHRGAGEGAQPGPDHVHHGLRARGLLGGGRGRRVGRGDRRPARHPHGQAGRDDGGAAADRLVPRRPGGRPGAGAAVVHRPRGPPATSRWCCPGRARTSCSAATRSTRSRCRWRRSRRCRARCAGCSARRRRHLPEGMRGKDLLRRGALPLEQRYYGNARIFRDDQLARRPAPLRPAARRTSTSPRRTTPSPSSGTRWRGCSTSTCSPGCAATSSSRRTR